MREASRASYRALDLLMTLDLTHQRKRCTGLRGILRDFAGFCGILRDFAGLRGTSRDFAGFCGTLRDFAGLRGTSRDFAGFREIRYKQEILIAWKET
jgi:hypothetical protein